MPVTFIPDNTPPVAKVVPVDPLPLPAAPEALDASSATMVGTAADAVVLTTPAALDNTPPTVIT